MWQFTKFVVTRFAVERNIEPFLELTGLEVPCASHGDRAVEVHRSHNTS